VRAEKTSEGRKVQESIGRRFRGNSGRRERTRGEEQSFEAGEVVATSGSTSGRPGGPGSVLRRVEREPIVVGGSRQPRSFVRGRLTKPKAIRRSRVRSARRWMTAREPAASREVRDSLRGEDSGGEKKPQDGSGMKQGREVRACQETAERLRKPESGTEVGVTTRL
jgi:hypothetical protein